MSAPSGAPNTRRRVGMGEPVRLSTTLGSPVSWRIAGITNPARPIAQTNAIWTRAGRFNIVARTGRRVARATMRVIEPVVVPVKLRNLTLAAVRARLRSRGVTVPPAPHRRGVFMEVVFRLSPNTVSFGGLTFREVGSPATRKTGYYRPAGRASAHGTVPTFSPVRVHAGHNVVGISDFAGFSINPVAPNLPVTAGSYRWIIPAEVRMGSITRRLSTTVTQRFSVRPRPARITAPPLTGRFDVWKNRAHSQRVY